MKDRDQGSGRCIGKAHGANVLNLNLSDGHKPLPPLSPRSDQDSKLAYDTKGL